MTPETNPDRMVFYKPFDQHYQEFLSSSTMLAWFVPPKLMEEVLEVEDVWDKIGDEGFGVGLGSRGSALSILSDTEFLILLFTTDSSTLSGSPKSHRRLVLAGG